MKNLENELPDYTPGEYIGYLKVQDYIEYLEKSDISKQDMIKFVKSYLAHEQGAIKNGWRL